MRMETEGPKEPDIKNKDWGSLWREAHEEFDPGKRAPMMAEIKSRVSYADTKGLIDLNLMGQRVSTIARNSTWQEGDNNFYTQMYDLATNLEEDSQKRIVGREEYNKPENKGMIRTLIEDAADSISAENLPKIRALGGKAEDEWQESEWRAIGEKINPARKWNDIDEIKKEYEARKLSLEDDFKSLLNLDTDKLAKLITGPTPEAQSRLEEHARQMQERAEEMRRQREMYSGSERPIVSQLENGRFGGTFSGSYLNSIDWQPLNPVTGEHSKLPSYNFENAEDRELWLEATLEAFRNPNGPDVAGSWMNQLNYYVSSDIRSAYASIEKKRFSGLVEGTPAYREAQEYTDKLDRIAKDLEERLTQRVSLHALVMGMENSGGSASEALRLYLGDNGKGRPKKDTVDTHGKTHLITENVTWGEDILETDRIYDDNGNLTERGGIELAFNDILDEMGIEADDDLRKINGRLSKGIDFAKLYEKEEILDENGDAVPDRQGNARTRFKNKLVRNLVDGDGVNSWIEDKIREEEGLPDGASISIESRKKHWLELKTAWDLIIADGKYTQWAGKISEHEDRTSDKNLKGIAGKMNLSKGWGGDPEAFLYKPSTLVGDIKKQYQGKDRIVLDLLDEACRPVKHLGEKEMPKISFIGTKAKFLDRRADLVSNAFGGGPRGEGIGEVGGKIGEQQIRDFVELADTLNGNDKARTGYQLTTMLAARALAATLKSPEPTLWDRTIGKLAVPEDIRVLPNLDALQFLFGQKIDGRGGYVSEVLGGRMRVELDSVSANRLREVRSLLLSNDQNEAWRGFGELLNILGFVLDVTLITGSVALEATGIEMPTGPKRR